MNMEVLKASIIQMAIQGKLVPQDSNDEPASVLLGRIQEKKKQMVKEGKIKKIEAESFIVKRDNHYYENNNGKETCIDDEIPFDIPDCWHWIRIKDLGNLKRGNGIKRSDLVQSGAPCIRYGELYTTYDIKTDVVHSSINQELFQQCNHIQPNDLLITLTGETKEEIGKAVAFIGNCEVAFGGDLACLSEHKQNPIFISYCLNSPYCIMKKSNASHGDRIVHLGIGELGKILIPIPPLNEQERICKKIRSAVQLIDEVHSFINRFDALSKKLPSELRSSILEFAVRGKLVPQIPSDQPVTIGCKNPIIRRNNSYYEIIDGKETCIDDEIPFDIPDCWHWIRIKDLGNLKRGNGIKRSDLVQSGAPCIRYGELYTTYDIKTDVVHSSINQELFQQCNHIQPNDLLITLTGETKEEIGKAVAFIGNCEVAFGGDLACLSEHKQNPIFISYCLNSPYCIMKKSNASHGDRIVHLGIGELGKILIPIPPIDEQNRIVRATGCAFGFTNQLSD